MELSPADAGLCVKAGGMYLELGLFDEADRLAREAVHLAPQSAEAWQLHGRVALARGQPEPALADFHRALALAPERRETLLDTAEAYRRLDRPQRALATLAVLGETYGPDDLPAEVLVLEGLAQEALDGGAMPSRAIAAPSPSKERPPKPLPGWRPWSRGRPGWSLAGPMLRTGEAGRPQSLRPVSRSKAAIDGTSSASVAKP